MLGKVLHRDFSHFGSVRYDDWTVGTEVPLDPG